MDNKYDEQVFKAMAGLIGDITAEREKQGISQQQLAEMSGVKQSAISRMEGLRAMPQLDTVLKLLGPLNLQLSVKQKKLFKEDESMKFKSTDIVRLEVETISCHLNVTTSMDEDFHMVADNESDFTFEKEDGVIKIRQKKRNVLRWLMTILPTELKVTVPAGFRGEVKLFNHNCRTSVYSINLGKVTIKNGNGTLECEDFTASELKLINGNGRIEVLGARVGTLDGTSGNGRIKLRDVACAGSVKAKTGNGRLILSSCTAESFELRSSNGAILVSDIDGAINANTCNGRIAAVMRGNQADYSIDFSTSLGAIYIGNDRYQGRYTLAADGSGTHLEAFTTMGSIRVKFADTPDVEDGDFSDILQEEIDALTEDRDQADISPYSKPADNSAANPDANPAAKAAKTVTNAVTKAAKTVSKTVAKAAKSVTATETHSASPDENMTATDQQPTEKKTTNNPKETDKTE